MDVPHFLESINQSVANQITAMFVIAIFYLLYYTHAPNYRKYTYIMIYMCLLCNYYPYIQRIIDFYIYLIIQIWKNQ